MAGSRSKGKGDAGYPKSPKNNFGKATGVAKPGSLPPGTRIDPNPPPWALVIPLHQAAAEYGYQRACGNGVVNTYRGQAVRRGK